MILKIVNKTKRDAWVHYNDGRPWWKKRRPRLMIQRQSFMILDLTQNYVEYQVDLDRLWIKFGRKGKFQPLTDHCQDFGKPITEKKRIET